MLGFGDGGASIVAPAARGPVAPVSKPLNFGAPVAKAAVRRRRAAPAPVPSQVVSQMRNSVSPSSAMSPAIRPPMAPATPAAPVMPSLDQYLAGDATYKSQLDAQKKAIADYLAQMNGQTSQYNNQYTRDTSDLSTAEQQALRDQSDDYASRGLTNSGLFVKARSDLTSDYDKRESTLSTARANFLANLQSALTNFKGDQSLDLQKYRNDAIARRAAKYGL